MIHLANGKGRRLASIFCLRGERFEYIRAGSTFRRARLKNMTETAQISSVYADSAGIPVAMCGEMASDPLIVPILLGLGISELSMDPVYVPSVKAAIRSLTAVEAREMVEEILKLSTAIDVEAYAKRKILPRVRLAVPSLVEGNGS